MAVHTRIRKATLADEADIARICLLTGADGEDATGLYSDETMLADVYASPYLRGPSCVAWVVDVGGRPRGYVVAATDSTAFSQWFTEDWWPSRAPLHAAATPEDAQLVAAAEDPERWHTDLAATFPAHLHIDLLPELQGAGWGRRLIDTLCAELAQDGVAGVHLVASKSNPAAQLFHPKVGFAPIGETATDVTFARRLSAS